MRIQHVSTHVVHIVLPLLRPRLTHGSVDLICMGVRAYARTLTGIHGHNYVFSYAAVACARSRSTHLHARPASPQSERHIISISLAKYRGYLENGFQAREK